jgi:hypothetical protein
MRVPRTARNLLAFSRIQATFQDASRLKVGLGPKVHLVNNALRCTPKEPLMNTSNLARAAALVVSILVTFGLVDLVASYAYPAAPAVQLASAR